MEGPRYAVVINLDYERYPDRQCSLLWREIEVRMVAAGFRCDGRIFTIDRPADEACRLAREAIESVEAHLDFHRRRIYNYLREFYGFDLACATDLTLPPAEGIELEEPGPTSP
ncbi:MAG: hypothetical protein GWN84_04040 [Gammaproteobacteria bacterium]|nr:hypothetical protein [Gammaproteobacteria bacterium]NIR82170.1 hypothetical protein [Gammaproteobacteria bacterium]NIU03323.1 hypothetical protein [Gammaproteobacteria bacterium]NIW74364.1 hypothetical protein [Gemmatimonadota bacterium]NIX84598.1 hypothetical protein [Gammaproteobacteria bacterium]